MQGEEDYQEVCPYVERMGVCLEPNACFLKHKTMNLKAKEFIPSMSPPQMPAEEKKVSDSADPSTYQTYFDDNEEYGGVVHFVESSKNCQCCGGLVNNCKGEACQQLGVCYCIVVD